MRRLDKVNELKKVASTFDDYGKSYSETVNEAISFSGFSIDFFTRVKASYLVDIATSHFGRTDSLKLLDIGCGVGNFHPLLRPSVGALTGVDISPNSVEVAKVANPQVAYDVYDGARLPYADETFDAAYTICVMHHVPPQHWPQFVSEMKRVVRRGGLAIVFEHNPRNPLTMRIVNRCPFDEDAVLLTPETTCELFRKEGFTGIQHRSILTIPAANKLLRRVDQIAGRLPLGAQYYMAATRP